MTAVQESVSHLRENPYEIAQEQLRKVARAFSIDDNLVNVLSKCKKAVTVAIPVTMDDGHIEVFEGYRVTHNIARGPVEGRHPLPPRRHPRRGAGAVDVDDLEVLADGDPVRRRQGGRAAATRRSSPCGSSRG